MNFKQKTVIFVSTGFYLGKIPFAPGTFGSIPGLLLAYLISLSSLFYGTVMILIFIAGAIFISNEAETLFQSKDPKQIVIDEAAGMGVALLGLPFNMETAAAGFILFRLFDILKPFPIKIVERKLPGGTGIVMDDVLAGVFANIILRILFF